MKKLIKRIAMSAYVSKDKNKVDEIKDYALTKRKIRLLISKLNSEGFLIDEDTDSMYPGLNDHIYIDIINKLEYKYSNDLYDDIIDNLSREDLIYIKETLGLQIIEGEDDMIRNLFKLRGKPVAPEDIEIPDFLKKKPDITVSDTEGFGKVGTKPDFKGSCIPTPPKPEFEGEYSGDPNKLHLAATPVKFSEYANQLPDKQSKDVISKGSSAKINLIVIPNEPIYPGIQCFKKSGMLDCCSILEYDSNKNNYTVKDITDDSILAKNNDVIFQLNIIPFYDTKTIRLRMFNMNTSSEKTYYLFGNKLSDIPKENITKEDIDSVFETENHILLANIVKMIVSNVAPGFKL